MPLKLTQEEKECVKEWLADKDYDCCPFTEIKTHFCSLGFHPERHPVCKSWFPKITEEEGCPCERYKLSTVIRHAKEMVK